MRAQPIAEGGARGAALIGSRNIQPIVEGHGEVEAAPVLLRRLLTEAAEYEVGVSRPIRRKRSELIQQSTLSVSIRLAMMQPNCGAILVLLDSDDDCPRDLAPRLQGLAANAAGNVPCQVVLAHREYEAWFLAAIESLRGARGIRDDAVSHPRPESPRDAKGWIQQCMRGNRCYMETSDQAPLSDRFDLAAAHRNCRQKSWCSWKGQLRHGRH